LTHTPLARGGFCAGMRKMPLVGDSPTARHCPVPLQNPTRAAPET